MGPSRPTSRTTARRAGGSSLARVREQGEAPRSGFSRREVAEFAGCSLSAIDKAIEQRVVPKRTDHGETVIGEDGLAVMVMLCHARLDLPVKAKHLVREWISNDRPFAGTHRNDLELSDVVVLRVPESAREIVAEAAAYARDRDRLIVSDPDIFGGQPVIAGTRIPVHAMAERLEAGDSIDMLAEDFPHVDRRAFQIAARYARTHPRRGRPAKPWRSPASRRTSRV